MSMSSNQRASLLSGLRTGGVRTSSNPSQLQMNGPFTANVGGQFPHHGANFDDEQLSNSMAQKLNLGSSRTGAMSMTASAVDNGAYQQQQYAQAFYLQAQAQAAQFAAMSGQAALGNGMTHEQAQAFQMQMEFLRLQAVQQQQQQQFQAQILAQAQMQQQVLQQQQQQQQRRRISEPSTAGPLTTSFGQTTPLRARPSQTFVNPFNTGLGVPETAEVPMSAAIGGRFANRAVSSSLNPNATSFVVPKAAIEADVAAPNASTTSGNWRSGSSAPPMTPATPGSTTVISGGTSLGHTVPPKHDTATSWRRASVVPNSAFAQSLRKSPSPPASRSTSSSPPPTLLVSGPDETSPSPPTSRSISPPSPVVLPIKTRPQALRFSVTLSAPLQDSLKSDPQILLDGADNQAQVVIVNSDYDDDEDSCTPTPTTGSSTQSIAREEASKRLYEGLGIGRPAPAAVPEYAPAPVQVSRQVSQPARQPRGPPSGVEDLGARNFATRIRRKAIGGLGALMNARGRRESVMVEAY